MLIAIPKRMIYMMRIHLPKMMLPGGEYDDVCCTLFPYHGFVPLGFPCQGFNEATKNTQMIDTLRGMLSLK